MEKNHILAKWLNNELTEDQLAEFNANPDNEKYEQIKNYTAHLEVPLFNEEKVLEHVINHKKTTPKVIPSYKKWLFKVAAVFVIGLGIVFMMQNFALQTQYALNGKKTTFLLPDNSKVVLNAGSEIKYKKWNWDNNRNLELHGEAYFKVAKGKKFEVATVLGKVAVLGTQFNVKVRKDRFDVTCFEGRVLVKYQEKELILTPGQSVAFKDGKQINTTVATAQPEWMENTIAFNKENLRNILDEIERQYNISIEVKTKYSSALFTGKIPINNLDVALQIIATTYHLEPNKITANKIIFEGK
ncbi:FecR family protein [Flavobacterium xueshanense]|uniref:FecR family protein n=1 Tax=Flavobacterium xueshanense TaxID=935223 RepID=A0A1I2ES35_9FLAO|nr:FecR family protein [Flavobacterium xueshanense]SFE95645.1 FecR family protein [Flavobacterium xueshanense]